MLFSANFTNFSHFFLKICTLHKRGAIPRKIRDLGDFLQKIFLIELIVYTKIFQFLCIKILPITGIE